MGLLIRLCVVAAAVSVGGCYHYDPLWCLEDRDCADAPEGRRFCDTEGQYAESEGIARTCIAEPGGLSLSASADPIDLVVGRSVEVPLMLTRGTGLQGPVTVSLVDAAPGLTAEALTIPADATTGVLEVQADATASVYGYADIKVASALGNIAAPDIMIRFDLVGVPGTIDKTFGTEGTVLLERIADPLTSVQAVLVQADRIVVGGTRGVAGLRYDGILDSRFGTEGRLDLMPSITGDLVAIGSDASGRILMASRINSNGIYLQVVKYTRDGLSSSFFQVPGIQSSSPDPGSIVSTPADDVIVYGTDGVPSLWKVDVNGALVRRFGDGGRMNLPTKGGGAQNILLLREDGAAIIEHDDRLRRISVDGELDASYGVAGVLSLPTPGGLAPELRRAVPIGDGFAVIGVTGANLDIPIVWRLQKSGDLDLDFGNGGFHAFTSASGETLELRDVLAADGGGLYAVFHHQTAASSPKLMLMRLDAQGRLDTSYADGGRTSDDGGPWTPNRAALLPRHKVIAAGHDVARQQVIVRRYWY